MPAYSEERKLRLTNQIKDQIVKAAIVKAGIPEQIEALRQRRAAWAESCRIAALGEKVAAHVEQVAEEVKRLLAALPVEVLSGGCGINRRSSMHVNVAGVSAYARFNGSTNRQDEEISKPSLSCHTLLANDPLVDEFYAMESLQEGISSKRGSIESSVKAVLEKVSTDTKLVQVWPEAAELLPAPSQKKQLPAIPTSDLNALIGLPSGKEAV